MYDQHKKCLHCSYHIFTSSENRHSHKELYRKSDRYLASKTFLSFKKSEGLLPCLQYLSQIIPSAQSYGFFHSFLTFTHCFSIIDLNMIFLCKSSTQFLSLRSSKPNYVCILHFHICLTFHHISSSSAISPFNIR